MFKNKLSPDVKEEIEDLVEKIISNEYTLHYSEGVYGISLYKYDNSGISWSLSLRDIFPFGIVTSLNVQGKDIPLSFTQKLRLKRYLKVRRDLEKMKEILNEEEKIKVELLKIK